MDADINFPICPLCKTITSPEDSNHYQYICLGCLRYEVSMNSWRQAPKHPQVIDVETRIIGKYRIDMNYDEPDAITHCFIYKILGNPNYEDYLITTNLKFVLEVNNFKPGEFLSDEEKFENWMILQ